MAAGLTLGRRTGSCQLPDGDAHSPNMPSPTPPPHPFDRRSPAEPRERSGHHDRPRGQALRHLRRRAGRRLRDRAGRVLLVLGPSGCGKTTTLRMIAGLRAAHRRPDPARGQGRLAGPALPPQREHRLPALRAVPAHDRGRQRRLRAAEPEAVPETRRARRVRRAAGGGPADRSSPTGSPAQLSGGQQQRVALARALANYPSALLLDEPLGALDLKLRQAMQIELKRIQREVGITFIYVTHDQEEALTMSDRIAVMNEGRVEQIGTPQEIYHSPTLGLRRQLHRRRQPDPRHRAGCRSGPRRRSSVAGKPPHPGARGRPSRCGPAPRPR